MQLDFMIKWEEAWEHVETPNMYVYKEPIN